MEALFAFAAGDLIVAISQQLRRAEPLWATALVVWVGLAKHNAARPIRSPTASHIRLTSVAVLFFRTALPSSQRRLVGMPCATGRCWRVQTRTTVLHDLEILPRIPLRFLLVGPTFVVSLFRVERPRLKTSLPGMASSLLRHLRRSLLLLTIRFLHSRYGVCPSKAAKLARADR